MNFEQWITPKGLGEFIKNTPTLTGDICYQLRVRGKIYVYFGKELKIYDTRTNNK